MKSLKISIKKEIQNLAIVQSIIRFFRVSSHMAILAEK